MCFSKLYGDQARYFESEKVPRIKHKKKGTVSMVNNGSDQHGSQVSMQYWDSFARTLGLIKGKLFCKGSAQIEDCGLIGHDCRSL